MAQLIKRISDPYLITATADNQTLVTIGSAVPNNAILTVNGNLVVTGTQTSINSIDLSVTDNMIMLNAGETGDGVTKGTAGISVDRGPNPAFPPTGIIWDEPTMRWQISNDGLTYQNIATVGFGTHYISKVVEDTDPHLGGNLISNGFSLTSDANTNLVIDPSLNIQVEKPIQLKQVLPPSAPIPGYSLIHGGPPAGGESGVYISNELEMNRELITERRAIVYALIF